MVRLCGLRSPCHALSLRSSSPSRARPAPCSQRSLSSRPPSLRARSARWCFGRRADARGRTGGDGRGHRDDVGRHCRDRRCSPRTPRSVCSRPLCLVAAAGRPGVRRRWGARRCDRHSSSSTRPTAGEVRPGSVADRDTGRWRGAGFPGRSATVHRSATDNGSNGGWRVAFLLAIPLALIGLYIRQRVERDPGLRSCSAASTRRSPDSARQVWVHHRSALKAGFALIAAGSIGFNVFFVFVPNRLITVDGPLAAGRPAPCGCRAACHGRLRARPGARI